MKDLGYGSGYQYAHDAPDARVEQEHLPEALRGRQYYRPTDRGLEAELGRRLAELAALAASAATDHPLTLALTGTRLAEMHR